MITFLCNQSTSIACTYALGPDIEIEDFSFSSKPAIQQRAPEIGRKLAESGVDVAALSEVFKEDVRDALLNGWLETASLTRWEQGPPALTSLPDIPLPFPCPPSPIPPHLGTPALKSSLGNSGLLTLIRRHPTVDVATMAFEDQGDILRDIDALSRKGVLKVSIDVGFGVLSIFSTHVYAGGSSIFDASEQHRDSVKRNQFEQIALMIAEEQRLYPERVCILGGDFNRNGNDNTDTEYQRLVTIMSDVNMVDLWDQRARDEGGNRTAGPTTIDPTDVTETRIRCPAGGRSAIHCDERFTSRDGGRIDYIFVQAPAENHSFDIELQRPRRIFFEMDTPAEGMRYLSDHLGLETLVYARPRG